MKHIVVFSGAGVSAESGISTFRDSGGLWEQYPIEEVATPEAFARNPELVLDFYNQRRRKIGEVLPNEGHKAIAELEQYFEVDVVTQNIDDLHERAGSTRVLHLHGQITHAKPAHGKGDSIRIGYKDIKLGDLNKDGIQLRPDIVWFGEEVPNYGLGMQILEKADILIVVGTSLNVYPAAGLIHYAPDKAEKYILDPHLKASDVPDDFVLLNETSAKMMPRLARELISTI